MYIYTSVHACIWAREYMHAYMRPCVHACMYIRVVGIARSTVVFRAADRSCPAWLGTVLCAWVLAPAMGDGCELLASFQLKSRHGNGTFCCGTSWWPQATMSPSPSGGPLPSEGACSQLQQSTRFPPPLGAGFDNLLCSIVLHTYWVPRTLALLISECVP